MDYQKLLENTRAEVVTLYARLYQLNARRDEIDAAIEEAMRQIHRAEGNIGVLEEVVKDARLQKETPAT